MTQKLLANSADSSHHHRTSHPPAFSLFCSAAFFSFLDLKCFHIKQPIWPLHIKPKKKQTLQWHRFACYFCCGAQGSIKLLKKMWDTLKRAWEFFGAEKKNLDSFLCLYLCHWAKDVKQIVILLIKKHPPTAAWLLKAQWGEMSHRLYICHMWISAWNCVIVS